METVDGLSNPEESAEDDVDIKYAIIAGIIACTAIISVAIQDVDISFEEINFSTFTAATLTSTLISFANVKWLEDHGCSPTFFDSRVFDGVLSGSLSLGYTLGGAFYIGNGGDFAPSNVALMALAGGLGGLVGGKMMSGASGKVEADPL